MLQEGIARAEAKRVGSEALSPLTGTRLACSSVSSPPHSFCTYCAMLMLCVHVVFVCGQLGTAVLLLHAGIGPTWSFTSAALVPHAALHDGHGRTCWLLWPLVLGPACLSEGGDCRCGCNQTRTCVPCSVVDPRHSRVAAWCL